MFKTAEEYNEMLGIKPTPKTYKVDGKVIEDEGRVHLTLRFDSISDMVKWMDLDMGIRSKVASDIVKSKRQFIASKEEEGGQRLSITETEEVSL